MVILYIAIFLFVLYAILILYYWRSWQSIPEYVAVGENPNVNVTVVIPARNEEQNVRSCLASVCNQEYPNELLQIIMVDDSSTDATWDLAQKFSHGERQMSCIHLEEVGNSGFSAHKKRAIDAGIKLSQKEFIVTTDADCSHPHEWIKTIASFCEQRNSALIVAPVIFENNTSLLQMLQALDFLVLQGITGATVSKNIHTMCNGANLAYKKEAFDEVNGFEGIDRIASGDDMLLMYKIWRKYPTGVHYLKSKKAIVSTQPMKTWKEFLNQRIRWASKARFYKERRIFFVLLLVYLFNFSFLALFLAGFWFPVLWLFLLGLWAAKTIVEFPFVNAVAKFFNKQYLLRYFFFFQPLHICYTIVAGCLGQFGRYEWKGRKVK